MINAVEQAQTIVDEYLTFYIGKELVAIKLKFVETIEFLSEIIPIPRAPPHVSGVVKIENSIIPIINLDVLLDTSGKQNGESPIAVIIAIDTAVFGIYISEPPKVTSSDQNLEKAINIDSKNIPSQWVIGQIENEETSFFVLDPYKFWIGLGTSSIVGPTSNILSSESDLKSTISEKEEENDQIVKVKSETKTDEIKDIKKKVKKEELAKDQIEAIGISIEKKSVDKLDTKLIDKQEDIKDKKKKGKKKDVELEKLDESIVEEKPKKKMDLKLDEKKKKGKKKEIEPKMFEVVEVKEKPQSKIELKSDEKKEEVKLKKKKRTKKEVENDDLIKKVDEISKEEKKEIK